MTPQDEEVTVTFRSPSKRKGFAQVAHVILTDPTLSDAAVRLYGILRSYAMQSDYFTCGQKKMAEDAGKEDRTIRRLLKELEDRGLITIKRNGKREVNAYIIEDEYALYDVQPPQPRKRVRTEIGPDKNDRSPDRTKIAGRSGQKSPVVADKNVRLLKSESNKEYNKAGGDESQPVDATVDQEILSLEGKEKEETYHGFKGRDAIREVRDRLKKGVKP